MAPQRHRPTALGGDQYPGDGVDLVDGDAMAPDWHNPEQVEAAFDGPSLTERPDGAFCNRVAEGRSHHMNEGLGGVHGRPDGIAAEADISIGSLYQYFPNKDALLVALAERHLDETSAVLAEIAGTLRADAPTLEEVCRTLVTATVVLNSPGTIHQLLWQAPRTEALKRRLTRFEAEMAAEVAWHLERFGHDSLPARRRAEVMVTAVTAGVHMCTPGDDLGDELVALCLGYAAVTPSEHPHRQPWARTDRGGQREPRVRPWVQQLSSGTSYCARDRSAEMMVIASQSAWAMRRRSNGSRW